MELIVDGTDEEEEDVFVLTSTENEIPYLPFAEQTELETDSRDCVIFIQANISAEVVCGFERSRAVFCEAQSMTNFKLILASPRPLSLLLLFCPNYHRACF